MHDAEESMTCYRMNVFFPQAVRNTLLTDVEFNILQIWTAQNKCLLLIRGMFLIPRLDFLPLTYPLLLLITRLMSWQLVMWWLFSNSGQWDGGMDGSSVRGKWQATEMQAQKCLLSMSLLLKLIQVTVKRKILPWVKLLQILANNYHLVIPLTFCSKYRMNAGSLLSFSFFKKAMSF